MSEEDRQQAKIELIEDSMLQGHGSPAGMRDKVRVSGHVDIYELPPDFTYEDYRRLTPEERKKYLVRPGPNKVLYDGIDQIVDLMVGSNTNVFNRCGVGSSATAADSSQHGLISAIGSLLIVTNAYRESPGKAHFDTFFTNTDAIGTWRESIIATAAGLALARRTFPDYIKGSNSAVVAWTISFTII